MHCNTEIQGNLYIRKPDGTFCCDRCYFKETYLEGIINKIEGTYLATIEAFVSAIDAREHEVGNHSLRVTQFALVIGHRYGLRGRDLVDLYCGALLHDIGKIGIPDAILLKKGHLTHEEQTTMRRHPEIGFGIVSHIGYLSRAAEIVRAHHEHFDGTGYPQALKGEEIPLGARIFAIADAFDALTVKRPYHEAVQFESAEAEIRKASGSLFAPDAVEAFADASGEIKDWIGRVMI
jgi:putative nucleotidyltransferase with HDIG domain